MDALEERLQNPGEKRTEICKQSRVRENTIDLNKFCRHTNFIIFDNHLERKTVKYFSLYSYCILSVIISFIFGLSIGVILMTSHTQKPEPNLIKTHLNKQIDSFSKVTFTGEKSLKKNVFPKGISESMEAMLRDKNDSSPTGETILYDNIFWGPAIEDSMPQGYGENSAEIWQKYVDQNEIIKMEPGCGRMQNRLVTFKDGCQACVRYRQNTDQIQGEIFSFYTGRLLKLTNLAPSVVKVVDIKDNLWRNVANEIGNALWNSNRAVVLTKYIPSLESASIPDIFKPISRHLNKNDVLTIVGKENGFKTNASASFRNIEAKISKKLIKKFVELAQWSDLIIFDYLTANLDRMVNNLFNYQWNVNIMDGPAHNLARKMDSGLLVFLDNESGLLHGYRLLKKYNAYHNLLLNNLCVFRRRTVDSLKYLFESQSVGSKINELFHKNGAVIRDILPALPDKNANILHERIGMVLSQVEKCTQVFR